MLKKNHSNLSLEGFAAGVVRVVNANMEKAIRVVSIERGHDPREFSLVAFGGAGAMHACDLAQALRIPRVIVPAYPGALSAVGILISDVVKDHSRTVLLRVASGTGFSAQLDPIFAELKRNIAAELMKEDWQGKAVFEPSCDIRYRGQGYELNLPYAADVASALSCGAQASLRIQQPGARRRDRDMVRMRAGVASPEKPLAIEDSGRTGEADVRMRPPSTLLESAIGRRSSPGLQFKMGRIYRGPAIITEYSATTVIPARPDVSKRTGPETYWIEV